MCYTLLMERGICKIADGWWAQHSVLVEHESGRKFEMPEELYRASKYEPPSLKDCPHVRNCRNVSPNRMPAAFTRSALAAYARSASLPQYWSAIAARVQQMARSAGMSGRIAPGQGWSLPRRGDDRACAGADFMCGICYAAGHV